MRNIVTHNKRLEAGSLRQRFAPLSLAAQAQRWATANDPGALSVWALESQSD